MNRGATFGVYDEIDSTTDIGSAVPEPSENVTLIERVPASSSKENDAESGVVAPDMAYIHG
jgi:hypothetical protein